MGRRMPSYQQLRLWEGLGEEGAGGEGQAGAQALPEGTGTASV